MLARPLQGLCQLTVTMTTAVMAQCNIVYGSLGQLISSAHKLCELGERWQRNAGSEILDPKWVAQMNDFF